MKEPNNPFTHMFSAKGVGCEKGDHKIGPYFELGCGHCLCQNCVLVSSRECPLCRWVPHQTITAMFTKYFPNLHIPESATLYVPTPKNEMFNAFGFYLGASLTIEMCALFLNGALCHNTAVKSIESVFESIGDHVPDQFIETIVMDVHYKTLTVSKTVQYQATSTSPIGSFADLVQAAIQTGVRKAFVLAKNAIHISILVEGHQIHVFDPFGTGRSRLPYIATFKDVGDCLPYLRTRLRNGAQPDFVDCQHTAELDVFEIAKLPSPQVRTVLTPPPPVALLKEDDEEKVSDQLPPPPDAILSAINEVRKAAGVASVPLPAARKKPPMSPPIKKQSKYSEVAPPTPPAPGVLPPVANPPLTYLQEAMIGVPEVPWLPDDVCRVVLSQLDVGSKRISREEENLRGQLSDWESCSRRTVKCAGYLHSKPDLERTTTSTLLNSTTDDRMNHTSAWSEYAAKSHLLECIELHTARKVQQQKEQQELLQLQRQVAKQTSLLVAQGEKSILADTAPVALDFSGISSVNIHDSKSHLIDSCLDELPLAETSINLLYITPLCEELYTQISQEEANERPITVAIEQTAWEALCNWERVKRCIVVTPSSSSDRRM